MQPTIRPFQWHLVLASPFPTPHSSSDQRRRVTSVDSGLFVDADGTLERYAGPLVLTSRLGTYLQALGWLQQLRFGGIYWDNQLRAIGAGPVDHVGYRSRRQVGPLPGRQQGMERL